MTLLSLLALFWDDGNCDGDMIRTKMASFGASVSRIHGHILKAGSLSDDAVLNLTLGAEGSLRRAPNIITWVGLLSTLKAKAGFNDFEGLAKAFNKKVGNRLQLSCAKAMGVRQIIDAWPAPVTALVSTHVSNFGWDRCAFSDDSVASKKILPNYQPKAQNMLWLRRSKITEASVLLGTERAIKDHQKFQPAAKRAHAKMALEQLIERASITLSWLDDLLEIIPLLHEEQAMLLEKFVDAHHALELEMH